jgi:hypothetical protein
LREDGESFAQIWATNEWKKRGALLSFSGATSTRVHLPVKMGSRIMREPVFGSKKREEFG